MKKLKYFPLLIIFFIYLPFFSTNKTLSSGDFPYLFLENIKEFTFFPNLPFLWLTPYYHIGAKILGEYLGLNWNLAEKILWFWPFLFTSVFSSFYLTRSWIGVLIYTASTYPLMLVGGGQMGVAIAYSLAPLVLASFIKTIDFTNSLNEKIKNQKSIPIKSGSNIKYAILIGFILGLQVMFDPRITYITFIAVGVYFLLSLLISGKIYLKKLPLLLIPLLLSVMLNSFWIVSLLKFGFPKGLEGNMSLLGFQFLSFADFSHAFSALHPNWPENIFGKVYFMRSEFILLPVLAYSSLFFISSKITRSTGSGQKSKPQLKTQNFNNLAIEQFSNKKILFFSLLGLLGAFLAKGANEPFGFINEFLFQYFPGMNLFRDATKFYLLIVISYSVLIPFTIYSIQDWLKSKVSPRDEAGKSQNYLPSLFLIFIVLYLLFLIRPAIKGELGGTFKPRDVPKEYLEFKNFISGQNQPFKTFWIPSVQRFGFKSSLHPALEANKSYGTDSASLSKRSINNDSVKYIIVPLDNEKEIFIEDRKYSEEKRTKLIKGLESLPWLQKIPQFGDLAVFEVK